ncbi:MAG TPA: M17 family peptidase N-terminal domain-containing protein, partial [Thermoanaerobaculia bacterium]|nr:M17 family peptidase N-terminal domain-containing protein [Thermoanaerobaculia bacterium]
MEVRDTLPRSHGRLTIAFLPEGTDPAASAAASARPALREACRMAGFRGREKEVAGTRTPSGAFALVGLGRPPYPAGKMRRAVRHSIRAALLGGRDALTLVFGEGISPESLRMLVREIAQADYSFERYKSRKTRRPNNASAYVIAPHSSDARAMAALAREAQILVEPVAWARDLGNMPGNDLGPADFAREVRKMARPAGLRVSVLGKREIQRERMGGLLAVNAGSTRPPVFAIGEYRPRRSRGTAVLVGKGITFDSGGISIKPAPSMGEMKYDMMGAATVFACLAAAKRLLLPVRVVALAPLTENMPGGSATRPGDILRMRAGKTVEVDNTDAEGRLILADALSYAEK